MFTLSLPARLVLICGLPGSGKTTLARRLADELPAVRICPDEWMARLDMDLFDEPARDRLERTLWRHAQDLLGLRQSVILEYGFWGRDERDSKRLAARDLGVLVELRFLDPPLDELWHRLEQRNAALSFGTAGVTQEQLREYAGWLQSPDQAELDLFDPPLLP